MADNLDGWVVVDDQDPSIQYDGLWRPARIAPTNSAGLDATYNGSVTQPAIRGGMSFKFTGGDGRVLASVEAATERNISETMIMDSMFSWECFIDGQQVDSGTLSDIERGQNNYELCRWRGFSIANRTLTVNVSTQEWVFGIDRIQYIPAVRGGYTIVDPLANSRITSDAIHDQTSRELRMNVNGSKMGFEYFGTSVAWYGRIEDSTLPSSLATYQIDDEDPVTFDVPASSEGDTTNLQFFETPTRTSGAHTLTVTYTGSQASMPLVLSSLIVQEDPNEPPPSSSSSVPNPAPDASRSSSTNFGQSTSSAAATSEARGTKIPLGPIIGAVAGVAALLFIIIIILCLRLRKQKRTRPKTFDFYEVLQPPFVRQLPRDQPTLPYQHGWYNSGTATSQATSTQTILTYPEGIQIVPSRVASPPSSIKESCSGYPVSPSQELGFAIGSLNDLQPDVYPEAVYAIPSRVPSLSLPTKEIPTIAPVSRPPEARFVTDAPKKTLQDPLATVGNPYPTTVYHQDGGVQMLVAEPPPPLPVREYPPEYASTARIPQTLFYAA